MPLVTSKEMLLKAQEGGYAVGAFNAENMEMVKAIIQAAEELKAPVMIQTTPSTVKYGTVDTYAAIVAAEAKKASVPVCLHLDHGSSFELAMQAIHAGYTSVMIDGSKLDFEANIAETKRVADVANALDIPCEAELGKVGGKEDDLEAEADTNTDPQEAKEFVERWASENGPFGIEKVIQGAKTESVPLGELKKLSEERMLLFDEDLMTFAMGNCITLEDTNGNRKLLKKRYEQKIDAVAAMMDAYIAFKANREAFE